MSKLKRVLSGKYPSITFDLVKKIAFHLKRAFLNRSQFHFIGCPRWEMKSRSRCLKYLCFLLILGTAYQCFIARPLVMKIVVILVLLKSSQSHNRIEGRILKLASTSSATNCLISISPMTSVLSRETFSLKIFLLSDFHRFRFGKKSILQLYVKIKSLRRSSGDDKI